MTGSVVKRSSVDDYLGPGETRFFGSGYKRAQQSLTQLRIDTGATGAGTVRGRAAVRYPADWSRKGSANQPPHLSSVDVLLIAGEVAELYLTHALRLDEQQRSRMRLRRVRIKAGSSPVEQELAGFGVSAELAPAEFGSVIDCRVGSLRAWCDIEHPDGARRTEPGSYAGTDELLGPAARRPFGAAHQNKNQLITDLDVDVSAGRAAVLLDVSGGDGSVTGLESGHHRTVSIIDAFVVAIQLGQILLYGLDTLSRAESNTLWMRQTLLEIGAPEHPVPGPVPLSAHLDQPELLTSRDGRIWRTADIVASCDHLSVRCSITHLLTGTGDL
jgi:hypothetical protein